MLDLHREESFDHPCATGALVRWRKEAVDKLANKESRGTLGQIMIILDRELWGISHLPNHIFLQY